MQRLVTKITDYANKPAAPAVLFGVSVTESVFFPIPPDVMLIPMCIGRRASWLNYAALTTFGSIIGAIIGFFIGQYAFVKIGVPILESLAVMDHYYTFESYYAVYGAALLLLAGVTPIPFKVFTISSGALGMQLAPFILYCLLGRSIRFIAVGFISAKYGPSAARLLSNNRFGALLVVLCIITIIGTYWLSHG